MSKPTGTTAQDLEETSQDAELDPASPPLHSWTAPAAERKQVPALDLARLQYRRLAPRREDPHVGLAYKIWKQVWSATFFELDGDDKLFSDDFTRQDEISALFIDDECVGMTAHRWVDFAELAAQEDSYFKPWPVETRAAILEAGRHICIGSHLTVAETWRGPRSPCTVKELLLALSVEGFLLSKAEILVGTLRNNRGINELGYRLGSRPVATSVPHHGVDVDLVIWDRDLRKHWTLSPVIGQIVDDLLRRSTCTTE